MDIEKLMSGIALVIDDQLAGAPLPEADEGERQDMIEQIVNWFETTWNLPFVRMTELPPPALRLSLLSSASFVLLDWRLWSIGGDELKRETINEIREFLKTARESLVPVFILTNESTDDVAAELRELPKHVYDEEKTDSNFVFVKQKNEFWTDAGVDVSTLNDWVYGNASVYALKTWYQVMDSAKSSLFRAMCQRSVNWPKVFWRTYQEDGADPSVALTNMINDSLRGRMRVDAFEEEYLAGPADNVPDEELRGLIAETNFLGADVLSENEVRCGDLFHRGGKKYWLNLRPDCDCIPRGGEDIGDIEVHCVEGIRLGPSKVHDLFNKNGGYFEERVFQSIVFGIVEGKSILFDFRKLRVCKYSAVREQREGRLLHPYVTRVQQRHALFIQRQALPRIPAAAVPSKPKPKEKNTERVIRLLPC